MNPFRRSKNKTLNENTFPYLNSGPAAEISATLGDSSDGPNTAIPYPQGVEDKFSNRGAIIPGGIGDTDYIDSNTIQHGVFAGNS